jgi:hypothetical protein
MLPPAPNLTLLVLSMHCVSVWYSSCQNVSVGPVNPEFAGGTHDAIDE